MSRPIGINPAKSHEVWKEYCAIYNDSIDRYAVEIFRSEGGEGDIIVEIDNWEEERKERCWKDNVG